MIKVNGQNAVDAVFDWITGSRSALSEVIGYVWEHTSLSPNEIESLTLYSLSEHYVNAQNREHAKKVAPVVS